VEASDEATQGTPPGGVAPRRLLALPALLLIGVAIWEIVATRCAASAVADDAAWTEAASVVRAGYRPGDLIVFAPDWIDPVGRLHLGDLIPLEVAARMDADRFGRIWELSIRDARAPETAGLSPVATAQRGGVTIRRFERTPVTVLADLRERLATARVESPGRRPTLELTEVGFAPRRCIQIVPVPGTPARITFPAVPLGSVLVGYVGIADVFTRRDNRAPARLEVQVGGATVAEATAGVDDGWVRFSAPTTPGSADVTIVAHATTPNRLVCFAAEARQ